MTFGAADVEEAGPTMIDPQAFRGRLIAAVPTPIDESGEVHPAGLRRLIEAMASKRIGGVAVGWPFGRWSRLSTLQRDALLKVWREGLGSDQWLIAPISPPTELRRPHEILESALVMARQARAGGVDLLLVEPPGALRGRPDRDNLVLAYHLEVAGAGLPILISYRRESSGGINYGPAVLAQLLARPEVLGVEIATIDGVATFQQIEALVRELAPTKVVVTGEERFLGYSLMCGADSAIVGLGCACPDPVLDLLEAHYSGDAACFLNEVEPSTGWRG